MELPRMARFERCQCTGCQDGKISLQFELKRNVYPKVDIDVISESSDCKLWNGIL